MSRKCFFKSVTPVVVSIAMFCASANAAVMNAIITGTANGGRAAEADLMLDTGNSTLTIDLKNTGVAAGDASQLLLGLFFNVSSGVTLTPVQGVATPNGFEPGYDGVVNNFGEGWAYKTGLSAFGKNSGIGGSGAANGIGPNGNFFNPGVKLAGGDYGIANGLNSPNPSIKTPAAHKDAVFTLDVNGSLDFIALADSLVFQWGTSLTEGAGGPGLTTEVTPVPEITSTAMLLGVALSGLVSLRRKLS